MKVRDYIMYKNNKSWTVPLYIVLKVLFMMGWAYWMAWGITNEHWLFAIVSIFFMALIFADIIKLSMQNGEAYNSCCEMEM